MAYADIRIPPPYEISKVLELAGLLELVEDDYLFDGEWLRINGPHQQALDEALALYESNLEEYLYEPTRKKISDGFGETARNFIEARYRSFRRELFQALLTEAVSLGLTNRAAYIRQLLDWVKDIVDYTIYLDVQLNDAETLEEMYAITPDFSTFEETDPEVTAVGALAIND